MEYKNCRDAIRDANAKGNTAIGWSEEKSAWVLYDPKDGAPDGVVPDLLCIKSGTIPIGLSEYGKVIVRQMLEGHTK